MLPFDFAVSGITSSSKLLESVFLAERRCCFVARCQPNRPDFFGKMLLDQLNAGTVKESVIDEKATRIVCALVFAPYVYPISAPSSQHALADWRPSNL